MIQRWHKTGYDLSDMTLDFAFYADLVAFDSQFDNYMCCSKRLYNYEQQ